jgi:hypothetical protein
MRSLLLLSAALLVAGAAHARPGDGWADTSPQIRTWFEHLMQPDAPEVSCCGEADAYEADEFDIDGDHYVAIITDARSDTLRNGMTRPHIAPGTRMPIPNGKMKFDAGNPTGHGYVFIGATNVDGDLITAVYCYVTPGGA